MRAGCLEVLTMGRVGVDLLDAMLSGDAMLSRDARAEDSNA
jgi:hypothetical protein